MRLHLAVAAVAALLSLTLLAQAQPSGKALFSIDTSRTTREVKVGEQGTLSVAIVPAAGMRVHEQAPLSARLKVPAGLAFAKTKLGHADVVNPESKAPELRAGFTARQAGEQTVEADLQFFICKDTLCDRVQYKVTVSVLVR